MIRRGQTCALLGAAFVLAGPVLAGCSGHAARPSAQNPTIQVSVDRCGQGWTSPHPGQQTLTLRNVDTRAGEVFLEQAGTGAVYAEVEPLGPGTSTAMDVNLGSGKYAIRCAMDDASSVTGPVVTIGGDVAQPVKPVMPVTQADLITATRSYEHYVQGRIPTLQRLTAALSTAVANGDRAGARSAWLPAHLEYERLGAAYGAFGDLDGDINGRPAGLPGGVHDPSWAGFHRIEYGLWHDESMSSLRTPTAALVKAVGSLGQEFAHAQIDPLDVSIRAHEISENALQFSLTGKDDFGSGSGLATVSANLDGTRTVLGLVRPLLEPRFRGLPAVDAALARTAKAVAAAHTAAGWAPADHLPAAQRNEIDSALSDLTEKLAPIASILEPRRGDQ